MQGIHLKFQDIPTIGFAHHFNAENYFQSYNMADDSFEIVYIKAGDVTAKLYDKIYDIEPGSILVLFRRLPIELSSKNGTPHTHCSVQIKTSGVAEFIDSDFQIPKDSTRGIMLPFITPPCQENELIKKDLYSIISLIGGSNEAGKFSASLCAMGVLSKLDSLYIQKIYAKKNNSSLLDYKIKQYISRNISKDLSLENIATAIGKSPNYLNSVFKKINDIGIHQYINREKVRIIGECIKNRGFSFREACESVSVYDISYGYRLFKKHSGVTPGAFLEGRQLNK